MAERPIVDPRTELQQLAAALRAHLLWQQCTGAEGLPAAAPPPPRRQPHPSPAAPGADRRAARVQSPRSTEAPAEVAAAAAVQSSPESALSERVTRAPGAIPTAELEALRREVAACTRCRLHAARTQTVFARGDGSARLCFVGEGPGADEDAQGLPFVGAAGKLLDRMIAAMGLSREAVYVCNIVKCRPPRNRPPEPDEMAACRPFLQRQLTLLDPDVIVALGATAVQGLLGSTEGITRMRGRWHLYRGKVAVMPTFHPAYLLRNPRAKRAVWEDLKAVLRQLGRPIPER